jgi:hypothetical protein
MKKSKALSVQLRKQAATVCCCCDRVSTWRPPDGSGRYWLGVTPALFAAE